MEQTTKTEMSPIPQAYAQLLTYEPKLITNFVPTDASVQRDAFMAGETRNPDHTYSKLESIDFGRVVRGIYSAGNQIASSPFLNPKHTPVYEQFIDGYVKKTQLMELACAYKASEGEAREAAKDAYMKLNIELYGRPDETTYRSLLGEKLQGISQKRLTSEASELRDELFNQLDYQPDDEALDRFRPSKETVAWMHDVALGLYGNMLARIPEQDTFSPQDVQAIFTQILHEEFGEASEDWSVDVEQAQSINVKSAEKRIVIPIDRGEISLRQLRGLVVHEIGVHTLRALMGESTDLEPLKNGLNDYYDSEEGLGKVMEQALEGRFAEAGVDHYIAAGLAYFDGADFRQVYETKWRMTILQSLKETDILTDDRIQKAKNTAYKSTMRIFRGTDDLPWFKDLAYYNGSADMWRHLENIRGDDIKFSLVLLGKANPANQNHQRTLLETATVS